MDTSRFTDMGRRIHVGMCQCGVDSITDLARRIGVSHQTARRWLVEADSRITALDAFKVGEVLRVSSRWLVTGQGHSTPMLWVGPNERALLLGFRELPEDARAAVMHMLREIMRSAACPNSEE